MEPILSELSNLLEKQIDLLQELLGHLDREQVYITKLSVDGLYEVAKLKENNVLKIRLIKESVQDVLLKLLPMVNLPKEEVSLKRIIDRMPPCLQRQRLKESYGTIVSLGQLIGARNQQNKSFIQESLTYINDTISVLTSSFQELVAYHRDGKQALLAGANSLLSREV